MSPATVFACGFVASIAVDVVIATEVFNPGRIRVPERYRHPMFYLLRLVVALLAGFLAIVENANSPILAVIIGASAPLIFRGLASTNQSTFPAYRASVPKKRPSLPRRQRVPNRVNNSSGPPIQAKTHRPVPAESSAPSI
jgi:hypothetical protein